MERGKWNQVVLRVKSVKGEIVNCGGGGGRGDWRVNDCMEGWGTRGTDGMRQGEARNSGAKGGGWRMEGERVRWKWKPG